MSIVNVTGLDKSNKTYVFNFSESIIELSHYIQTLNIEYVGLSFVKSEKNVYKYKLEIFNDDWVDNGTSRNIDRKSVV